MMRIDDSVFAPTYLVVKFTDRTERWGPAARGAVESYIPILEANPPEGFVSCEMEKAKDDEEGKRDAEDDEEERHYGPGKHPGTGTEQDVHAGEQHIAESHTWEAPAAPFDTLEMYAKKGPDGVLRFDPVRVAEVHGPILAQLAAQEANVDPDGPTLYMTGGGYGSGKSTLIDEFPELLDAELDEVPKAVRADPDWIKQQLPEMVEAALRQDDRAATWVHEESSLLAKKVVAQALLADKDALYDTSGDSSGPKLAAKVEGFRALGAKRVVANYVFPGSLEEAQRRVVARYEAAQGVRRKVPPDEVAENHADVSRTWRYAARHKTFEVLRLWSTAGPRHTKPTIIAEATDGEIRVHDQKLWDAFVAVGGGE